MAARKYFSEFGLNMLSGYVLVLQQDGLDQARAMSEELEKEFHIYLIARRPRITVDPESVTITQEEIKGKYRIQKENTFKTYPFCFRNALDEDDPEQLVFSSPYPHIDFEIHRQDGTRITWGKFAQALMRFGASDHRHLNLEVLYVGQAYGTEGSRNAADRLESHSTLQSIYAEAATRSPDQAIWLLLCEFNPLLMTSFGGGVENILTTDQEDRSHCDRVINEPLSEQQMINFTEAALIRYFQPEYNKLFKGSFPNPAHATYSECYDIDLNAVSVELNSEVLNFQLRSQEVPPKWRHLGEFPLHSREDRMYMFDLC